MPPIDDLRAQLAKLQEEVTLRDTVTQSAVTLISGLAAMVASLRQQLQEAIASQDPAALQAVATSMSAVEASFETDRIKLANALTANTPQA
jgi:hypothetical protein